MRRIILFLVEYRRPAILTAALFASVSLMLMGEGAKTRFARGVTTAIFNTGRFTFSAGIHMFDLWNENSRLRLKNLDLSYRLSRNLIAANENVRLRRMLGLQEKSALDALAATVIGRDMDRVVNTLIIDSGTRDGIRDNMACITADGLVGRIHETYHGSASVQIITDVNSRVSAMIPNRGAYGIVSWDGGRYLRLYGLPLINEVKAGDLVFTTGFGNVFPGGILIGTVAKEPIHEVEIYASVNLIPAVDFSRVHELFVLKGPVHPEAWPYGDGTDRSERTNLQ